MTSSALSGTNLPLIARTPVALSAARSSDLMEVKDWLSVTKRRMVVLWDLRRMVQFWGSGGVEDWDFFQNVSM